MAFLVLMPECLRSEEKLITSVIPFISSILAVPRNFCFKAVMVAFSEV